MFVHDGALRVRGTIFYASGWHVVVEMATVFVSDSRFVPAGAKLTDVFLPCRRAFMLAALHGFSIADHWRFVMCTSIRFSTRPGHFFFARNLDWSCGYGQVPLVIPRNYAYESAFCGRHDSGYAVVGMGITASRPQGAAEIPLYFDCANEAGLAVGGLNFPGYAEYEKESREKKTNVAAYEFPFWLARRFASVDEAERALSGVAVVGESVNEGYPVSYLHWMIADKDRSIVVECMADGLHVYHDDADVLANQPTFPWHRENLRNYLNCSSAFPSVASWGKAELIPYGAGAGMRGLPGDYYSPSRFVRAAYLNAHYPQQDTEQGNVTRAFRTLGGVSMVKGAAAMGDGTSEYTVYTGGFSSETQRYYYSTYDDPTVRYVSLRDFDLDGGEIVSDPPASVL